MFPFKNDPGVYLIQCTVNGATYTGSTLYIQKRLQSHLKALRSGASPLRHLQNDWTKYGEAAFAFYVCYRPIDELWYREIELTLLADSLDDHGGYNKMLANQEWSLSSRVKNTELKLLKKRKFEYLPGTEPSERLAAPYLKTVCQALSVKTIHECTPKLHEKRDRADAQAALRIELESYIRFPPITPTDGSAPADFILQEA